MSDELPVISIIMPTYNAEKTLTAAIESVRAQKYSNLEFIVIDGSSEDGTLEIIKCNESVITTWISEPDKGIYEAMNKGIDRATGQWLYFLGSDDQINANILHTIAPYLKPDLAAVFGDVVYDTGDIMHSWIGYGTLMQNTLHHQATFYNRELFKNFRYDTNYRIISDYELNLQIFLKKTPTLFVPYIISTCGSTGTSSVLSSVEVNHLRGKYIKNKAANFVLNTILETYYTYYRTKKAARQYLKKLKQV